MELPLANDQQPERRFVSHTKKIFRSRLNDDVVIYTYLCNSHINIEIINNFILK